MSFFQKNIPVLMYHQINRSNSRSSLIVSPKSFKDQVDWLEEKKFQFLSLEEVVKREGRIPLFERAVAFTFDDGFRDNREHALSLLLERGRKAALFVVVNWIGQDGFLDWKEIWELSDAGIEIGSHSLTHRWLPDISDSSELEREIIDSKRQIEDRIGKAVPWFCYPVGGVNQKVEDCVQKAGYRAAWVAGARPTYQSNNGALSYRRIKVSPSDDRLSHFGIKAYGLKGLFS